MTNILHEYFSSKVIFLYSSNEERNSCLFIETLIKKENMKLRTVKRKSKNRKSFA